MTGRAAEQQQKKKLATQVCHYQRLDIHGDQVTIGIIHRTVGRIASRQPVEVDTAEGDAVGAGQMLHVHSADDSTFLCEMTPCDVKSKI